MIALNFRDSKPIYEQIKDGIRRLIFSGVLSQDDKLPSVRELAQQLSINPNTIQRAYHELEAEGCIYSIPGKGSFIQQTDSITDAKKQQAFIALDSAVAELEALGISCNEICARIMKGKDST